MDLVIGNKIIITPMMKILEILQFELSHYNGKLKDVQPQNGQNIAVSCPKHKDGMELHASCQVFADPDDEYTIYGSVHCFSCGYKASLPRFIGDCFDENEKFGEEWLLLRCETAFISEVNYLPEIILDSKPEQTVLDESELIKYEYYHPYMWKRKLSKDIVDMFEVGYDPKQNMLTFPVRDEKGKLRFITGRSVKTKRFMIPKGVDKPVYLLYYVKQHNIKTVIVTEGQIDALTSWTYGMPCVATIGTPSNNQMKELNNSGIRTFITMFDNDEAGMKFMKKFNTDIRDDVLVYNICVPAPFKDINDLDIDTFYKLLHDNGFYPEIIQPQ